MATTVDARKVAGALYEALVGTALDQLRAAAPKLAGVTSTDGDLVARVDGALPQNPMPQVRNFLLGLGKAGLLGQVGEITEAFATYAATASTPTLDATITSAVPLSEAQRKDILADLQKRYSAEIAVNFEVDATLIGGLVVRVGDQVLDNSLRTRLSAVQRNMLAS